jgi:hypothetical protein
MLLENHAVQEGNGDSIKRIIRRLAVRVDTVSKWVGAGRVPRTLQQGMRGVGPCVAGRYSRRGKTRRYMH